MKKQVAIISGVIIWIIGIICILFVANTIIGMIIRNVYLFDDADQATGYVDLAGIITEPWTAGEDRQISAMYRMRTLLKDDQTTSENGILGIVTLTDFTLNRSLSYGSVYGSRETYEGVWALGVKDTDPIDLIKGGVGIVSIDRLCQESYASQLYQILSEHKNAKIHLNKYAIKDSVIVPISVTVKEQGSVLATYENEHVPDGYEIVEADDCILYNQYSEGIFGGSDSVWAMMQLVYESPRSCDIKTKNMIANIDYSSPSPAEDKVIKTLLGEYMYEHCAVSSDCKYSMAVVNEVNYMKSLLFYFGIFSVIWTILVIAILMVTLLIMKKRTVNQ